jgi:5-methylthioadenosine/S-adenosylhomocysteine deaminase
MPKDDAMILSAQWVCPISSPPLENGGMVVAHGRIADLGALRDLGKAYPAMPVRHFPGAALMPGFVNVHSHLELTVLRGYLEGLDFWTWIRTLTRTKYEILNIEDLRLSALLGAVEAIRAGVTTVADPMDIGTSFDAVLTTGLRGVLYQEVFSPRPEEAEAALSSLQSKMQLLEQRLQRWPHELPLKELIRVNTEPQDSLVSQRHRVCLGVSPHAPYTVSAPLFQKTAAFAKSQRYRVCIHAAESQPESQLLCEGSGPIAESYAQRGVAWVPPRCSPVRYLYNLGILTKQSLLVHCIHLDSDDFDLLRETTTSVAHCPKSNAKLRHGFMDLSQMLAHQIPVGLGSDSVASNNTMDLFEEMRFALSNPSFFQSESDALALGLPPSSERVLRLATLGGAEALGLENVTGSIERGKAADIISVDLSKAHCLPIFSPLDALVYSARADDVQFTMVAGEILFDKGKVFGIEEAALYQRIDAVRTKLMKAAAQARVPASPEQLGQVP